MATAFFEGGLPMYGILLCALIACSLACVALVLAFVAGQRRGALGTASVALLAAVGTAVIGVGGYFLGMHNVEEVVAVVEPALRETVRAQGQSEASWNLICGAIGAVVPALLASVALLRAVTMRASRSA
jgi:hypothetical protein